MAKAKAKAMTCAAVRLPAEMDVTAAVTAMGNNRANSPTAAVAAMVTSVYGGTDTSAVAGRLAASITRYWGSGGAKLRVKFLGSPRVELRTKVLKYMNRWEPYCNASAVEVTSGDAEVRCAFQRGGGHYSYIGSDCVHVPAGQQTMNLDLTLNDPESEFVRVVPHEFGHALGFEHEQFRSEIRNLLDVDRTCAVYQARYGWPRQMTMQQVFPNVDESDWLATPQADQLSIMCYSFDGECTKSGRPVLGGADLSDADKAFCPTIYPRAAPPTPPTDGFWPVALKVDKATGKVTVVQ